MLDLQNLSRTIDMFVQATELVDVVKAKRENFVFHFVFSE